MRGLCHSNVAVGIELSDDERAQLEAWARRRTSAQALAQRSRIVLLAAEGLKNTEIAQRLGVSRDMVDEVARPVCRAPAGWAARRAAAGAAAHDHRRAGRGGDRQTLETHAQGRDALVDASMAARGRAHPVSGAADLAGLRAAAPPPGHLEALQGPAVHREGPRRRRALSQPARARGRALRRREVPDPGARSHRADLADAARHSPSAPPTTTSAPAPRASTPRWTSRTGKVIGRAALHATARSSSSSSWPPRPRGPRRPRRPPRARQLLDPQDAGDPALAGRPPALRPALHPDRARRG